MLTVYSLIKNGKSKEVAYTRIKYFREADIVLIELRDGTPVDSIDLKEGVIFHLDNQGLPLETEILDASKPVSLKELSTTGVATAGK